MRAPPKVWTSLSVFSKFPAALWKHTRASASKPAALRRLPDAFGFIVAGVPVLIIAAIFIHTGPRPHRLPPAAPAITPPAPATTRPSPASTPYNGNFDASAPISVTIPNRAFVTSPLHAPIAESDNPGAIRKLQEDLKAFGLFPNAAITGVIDRPTKTSLRQLAMLTRSPTGDVTAASAALRSAQEHAEQMLWILGDFPFGKTLPSWLLASLDARDPDTLASAFSLHANDSPAIFSVELAAPAFIVRGRLFPDTASSTQGRQCYGFSALFERPPLQHHVISRACRERDGGHWSMAAHN